MAGLVDRLRMEKARKITEDTPRAKAEPVLRKLASIEDREAERILVQKLEETPFKSIILDILKERMARFGLEKKTLERLSKLQDPWLRERVEEILNASGKTREEGNKKVQGKQEC